MHSGKIIKYECMSDSPARTTFLFPFPKDILHV